jgi:phthalate 4,5-dioxygenase oxygenase subunit
MLTREDNELLCRIGAGTPMGELLREYWMPAVLSSQLEADGAPLRVRLLGENFVSFRATDGRVGFFDEGCPHRCTSLALARNEDNALTCIFHGWKIDVSGKVVEVPSEPPERRAEFAAKVRVRHYPVHESGGMIWVYLGKRDPAPAFPEFEFTNLPPTHCAIHRAVVHSNWVQGLETTIDSSHLGVLHSYWLKNRSNSGGALATSNNGPVYDQWMKPYGFREVAARDLFDDSVYLRIREVVAPFYSFVPMDSFVPRLAICLIPIDDDWHAQWYIRYQSEAPIAEDFMRYHRQYPDPSNIAADMPSREQVWGQDRKAMKEGHWSGLATLNFEDFAVAEAPGILIDRSREYLGSSDSTLIRYRRMMLQAVRDHQAGKPPMGLDGMVEFPKIRAVTVRAKKGLNWREIDPLNPPETLALRQRAQ